MNLNVISTGSKGNSYLLEHGEDSLLLDAGVPMPMIYKTLDFGLWKLDSALISHSHTDHIMSVKQLLSQFVPVVMSRETFDKTDIPDMFYPNLTFATDKQIEIKNWLVLPFDLEHDSENKGYLIYHKQTRQRICYITDTGFIRAIPQNINILIIECNYINEMIHTEEMQDRYIRVKETHMSLERIVSYLKKIDLKSLTHIVLIHLSDANSDEEYMVKTISDLTGVSVTAARNGLNINLDEVPF